MKRVLLFLAVFSLNQYCWAVISLVTHASASSGDSVSVTTVAKNTTGSTLIVVGCVGGQGSGDLGVIDSSLNTWTKLTVRSGGGLGVATYYSANPTTSAAQTFTCSNGVVFTYPSIYMTAFSGTLTASVFDAENGYNGGSNSPQQTGAVTPAGDGEVFVTAAWLNNQSSAASLDSGFTVSDSLIQVPGFAYGGAMGYLIQGTGALVNPTWTGGGADLVAAEIAAFKPASGGASSTICPSPFCGLIK